MDDNEVEKGIRGWLILVAIGVVLGPIRLLVTAIPVFQPIFTDGTWAALTTVGSEVYNPLWAPLLIGEISYNVAIFLASLYLAFLFFTKHYRFPVVYISIVVVSLVFIVLDAWFIQFIVPNEPMFDPATLKEFLRVLIAGIIWVPYMLLSKRVKATFVEKKPSGEEPQQAQCA